MAQQVHVELVDDIDGEPAQETVTFGLDGSTYEIDLRDANAAKLRDALAPYVASGRRLKGSSTRSTSRSSTRTGPDPRTVREWAVSQGMEVPARGRLPKEVTDAFNANH